MSKHAVTLTDIIIMPKIPERNNSFLHMKKISKRDKHRIQKGNIVLNYVTCKQDHSLWYGSGIYPHYKNPIQNVQKRVPTISSNHSRALNKGTCKYHL